MIFIIKIKSLKESIDKSDDLRILIARYRPRYLPKEKENWNHWWKDLAPGRDLWKSYIKDKKKNGLNIKDDTLMKSKTINNLLNYFRFYLLLLMIMKVKISISIKNQNSRRDIII